MQSRTSILSAFTLTTAMASGAAVAADLPKEGTFNATYSAFGTIKATTIGKERVMVVFDENGLTRSDGFSDHMTWHCWGMAEFVNGVGAPQGSCVGIDPAGDQVSIDFTHEKWHSLNEQNVHASATITAGTGKYTGITGGWTYVAHVNEFRTAVEGTFALDCTNAGSYKLP
jgi:hypothetical protein